MKNIKILNFLLVLSLVMFGCNPLKKMIELSKDQQINVNPNPLVMKAGNVAVNVESTLPVGMLPKGTSYTLDFSYDGSSIGSIEFKASDYPNSTSSTSKSSKTFTMPYTQEIMDDNAKLSIVGLAKVITSGKSLSTVSSEVADGLIKTITRTSPWNIPSPKANPGYTDAEETEATNVSFYFNQGSAYLKGSEKKSDRGEKFSAFLAEKNITKSVNIMGAHSPEGSTKVNEVLADKRGGTIEKYYREQMDKYDYKDEASSISFDIKPVVEDWNSLRRALRASDAVSESDRSQISSIINGGGSFVDKEKALAKLSSYKTLMKEVYPDLRTAKTEVITVIDKKPNNEILAIAQNIVNGSASSDALSHGELLFAASLTPDLSEKAAIYQAAVKWGGTWKAHSDFGSVHINLAKDEEMGSEAQMKLLEDAETQLNISLTKEESAVAHMNMASLAALKYDWATASEHLAKAKELDYSYHKNLLHLSMGTMTITTGDYEKALSILNMTDEDNGWAKGRRGVIQLMLGNISESRKEMNSLIKLFKDKEWDSTGFMNYILAICDAREGNTSGITSNLKMAFSISDEFRDEAVMDLEFKDYSSSVQDALK